MAHLRAFPQLMSSCQNSLHQEENPSRFSGQITPVNFLFSARSHRRGLKKKKKRGLTFSSLHHNFTSLAVWDGFRDRLQVHGIRVEVANKIDRITPYIPHPSSPADNIVQIRRPRLHVAKGLTTRIMTRFLSISLN